MGEEKIKILFLSSQVRYLSNLLYSELIPELKKNDCKVIYFESDFNEDIKYLNNDIETEVKLRNLFDEVVKIPSYQNLIHGTKSKIKRFITHYEWKNAFLNRLNSIQPDLIISISSIEVNFELADACAPFELLFIQPSFMLEKVPMKWKKKIKFLFFRHFLNLPFFRRNTFAPFESKKASYLIWTPVWVNQEIAKSYKINYCGYPFLENQEKVVKSETRIENVLVYLNKKSFIGKENWLLYGELYKSLIEADTSRNYILKIHPLDNFEESSAYFKGYDLRRHDISNTDYDAILSHWSTAIIGPLILNTPVILINPDDKFDFSNIHLSDYPFIATNPMTVVNMLSEFEINNQTIRIQEKFKNYLLGENNSSIIQSVSEIIMTKLNTNIVNR